MSARPGNWSLLDHSSDPVSGDPAAVRSEATYYTNMAATILEEANRLKTLGQDGELVGKYKKSLQEELGDLADEVGKAHQRYEGVGTALKPYAGALDEAKTESWGALTDAVTANEALSSANAQPTAEPADGKPLTEAQKTANTGKTTAIGNANKALGAAKKRLATALTDLNNAGKKAAGIINDQNNDSLKDHHHWWDVVVKIVKVLVEIANYVVIVLAVLSLFIPGLNVLGIIFLLSAAILLTDTILAATGNGSWLDVAVDFVGLVTCGVGGAAAKSGEMAAASASRIGARTAARELAEEGGMGVFKRTATYLGRRAAGKAEVANLVEGAERATKIGQAVKAGDRGMAASLSKLSALTQRFPNSAKIASRYAFAQRASSITRGTFYAGNATVAANTIFSGSNIPGLEGHTPSTLVPLKEATTMNSPHKVEEFRWSGPATHAFYRGTAVGGLGVGLVGAGVAEMAGG